MHRPGPLRDLPLERFLPPDPNLPIKLRSNKRPLSPGGPSLFSPAKRRILAQEGIFSPEKTIKSPIFARNGPAHSRFSDVLYSPSSPAKRLDFGVAGSSTDSSSTRFHSPSTHKGPPSSRRSTFNASLAPSPELSSKSQPSSPRPAKEAEDYFILAPILQRQQQPLTPTIIPHEVPVPPDPRSVHYPGFVVYCDPHIIIAPVIDVPATPSAAKDKDSLKENIPPRRKTHKVATAPAGGGVSQLLSPDAKKREAGRTSRSKSTPFALGMSTESATAKSDVIGANSRRESGLSLVFTPSQEMKQALKDETNGDALYDDDM